MNEKNLAKRFDRLKQTVDDVPKTVPEIEPEAINLAYDMLRKARDLMTERAANDAETVIEEVAGCGMLSGEHYAVRLDQIKQKVAAYNPR